MRKKIPACAVVPVFLFLGFFSNANSQEISSVSLSKPSVAVGEPVLIRVSLVSPMGSFACGLQVVTGDGRKHDVRIFEEKDATFEVSHTYNSPGTYAIQVDGKGFIRGLKSTFPCSGTKSVAIAVATTSTSTQPSCIAPSDEYRTVDCPIGTVGKIVQKRSYSCPGPVASGWSTQSTDCKAVMTGVNPAAPVGGVPRQTPPSASTPRPLPRPTVGE
jgi:hypothetical protein